MCLHASARADTVCLVVVILNHEARVLWCVCVGDGVHSPDRRSCHQHTERVPKEVLVDTALGQPAKTMRVRTRPRLDRRRATYRRGSETGVRDPLTTSVLQEPANTNS